MTKRAEYRWQSELPPRDAPRRPPTRRIGQSPARPPEALGRAHGGAPVGGVGGSGVSDLP